MISSVKPYARARLDALGYREWIDGFNFENIPPTLFDEAYHIELGQGRGLQNNQDHQIIEMPFTVRLFLRGFLQPRDRIDEATVIADSIIASFIAPLNRLTQTPSLKNIRFDSVIIEPLAASNDNSLIVRLEFAALLITSTR